MPLDETGGTLWEQFPKNTYIQRLLQACKRMGVRLDYSTVNGQWLYHPDQRTIYVWAPDLTHESLSFLVVILAHELGHARDFDARPELLQRTRRRKWWEMPLDIEIVAFVNGFCLLQELQTPINLDQYIEMIDARIATTVRVTIEEERLCRIPAAHKETSVGCVS